MTSLYHHILLLCIIVIFIYMNFIRKSLYLDKIESSVNGKKYYVRNLPDKEEAADKLSNIGMSLQNLIYSLDEKDKERGEDILRLKKSFNSDYITENIPGSMYVAYSVNKGEELSICIREKDTEKFIDNNTIINHEIDIEYPGKNVNKIRCNNYISTEHKSLFSLNELDTKNLELVNTLKKAKFSGKAKVRYRQDDQDCQIEIMKNKLKIRFVKPQRAVTPGQSVVIYKDEVCLGGGEIQDIS